MFIYLILIIFTLFYYYVKKKFSFWQRNDVKFIRPSFPFGNLQGFKRRFHSSQFVQNFYRELKGSGPFGGVYFFMNPVAIALDLEFIKDVLVRDFSHFHDRGMYYNEKHDPISAHLFNLEGERWKSLRSKLIPTFSSGKMKMMCPTIVGVGDQLRDCLNKMIEENHEIEMKDILSRFTTDIIGNTAFGLECNSLKDPDTEFRRMGKKVFEVPPKQFLKFLFITSFRKLSKVIGVKVTSDDVSKFFFKVVKDTIEYRERNKIIRNDFMNLLIQLKNDESNDSRLTLNEIVAQAFVFFLAGYETSSTTMSYCLYELALHQDIQDKARECVRQSIEKHNGLNYEAINDMEYLDQCIKESLRKYPPGANLIRVVTKDYQPQNSKFTFKKGMTIMIPIYAIHHDPEYYPNPEEYDPSRFTNDQQHESGSLKYLPFGEGPRICIGVRFGMMEARVGLAVLLMNFKFTKSSKTAIPLKISTRSVVLSPEGGLWLNVELISN
uniref:Putative cytochrome n=1 Tax=Corethrella appendiculata TaxID=1370023 RepID=U5EVH3_9DIPT